MPAPVPRSSRLTAQMGSAMPASRVQSPSASNTRFEPYINARARPVESGAERRIDRLSIE